MVIKFAGKPDSEIVVILDPADELFPDKAVSKLLQELLIASKADIKNVSVVRCAPSIPEDIKDSATKARDWMFEHRDRFMTHLDRYKSAKVFMVCGGKALQQYTGKKTLKVTDYYGRVKQVCGRQIIATSSIDYAVAKLDPIPILRGEFGVLAKLKACNYKYNEATYTADSSGYEWRVDISDVLKNKPASIAFDTETTGLDWKLDSVYPIVAQMTFKDGTSILTPLSKKYFPKYFKEKFGEWDLDKLIAQWKELLEDPNVKVIGHNIKFDMHMISKVGIEIANVFLDTMQMLHALDENSIKRNLDIAVKQYVPSMSGYADVFNDDTDKSDMLNVHPEKMISYAGGDTDATFRLAKVLYKKLSEDKSNLDVLLKIRMPAIKSFYRLEKTGIRVNVDKLPKLVEQVKSDLEERSIELIKMIPKKLLRKHAWISDKGDRLVPGNTKLIQEMLFSRDGINLDAKVFTAGTKSEKDFSKKVPSLSVKNHLVYFDDEGVDFIAIFAEYQKLSVLANTYIGSDEEEDKLKGLYKYIHHNPSTKEDRVHTSFNIDTVTSRSSSKRPNVQNLPQGRGDKESRPAIVAKSYKELFIPRTGYSIAELDYSQAEVRLAACAANDREMMRIYQEGLDVYKETAATVMMGISLEEFSKLPEQTQKDKRQAAKAVVLGFIYGLMARNFKTYAKTLFGVEFTDAEAENIRAAFFAKHTGFAEWHRNTRIHVKKYKSVKSLFGATRHLPSIDAKDEWLMRAAEREAINSPIQGDSSNMGLIALDCIYNDFDLNIVRPINFVHDALYFEIKTEYVEEYVSYLKWYMENIPIKQMFNVELPIPLVAEVEIGTSFADKKEFRCESIRPSFCTIKQT
jgi:DNA polymerase-1